MATHDRMRWYDPKLRCFGWREMPGDDGALALLLGYPEAEADAAVYREWRELGAGVVVAFLLRAREAVRARDEG